MVMMIMIAPNSRARKEEKRGGVVKGSMEEFEGRRRGMLIMGNGVTQSVTCCTICKSG